MKRTVGVLGVAVVLAGVAAIHMGRQLGAERRQANKLAAREVALGSPLPSPGTVQRLPEPEAPAAVAIAQPVATQVAVTTLPGSPPAAAAGSSPMKALMETFATPEGRDAMRSMMRGMMEQQYPDIERELGITEQEKNKLFDLLSDVEQDDFDVSADFAQDPAARRESQRKMAESQRNQEAKVSALLGARYPKWEEYQSTVEARQQVDQLRLALSVTSTPLTETQSKQLVTAFAAEHKRNDKETRDWSTSSAAINSPDMMQETMKREVNAQTRLVDVAAPVLDAAQLARYKRQVDQQIAMMRATMDMMKAGDQP
jgi:hypothetical protein